jgi:hypothetical protein
MGPSLAARARKLTAEGGLSSGDEAALVLLSQEAGEAITRLGALTTWVNSRFTVHELLLHC